MHPPPCTCSTCFQRAFERSVRRLVSLAGLRVRRPVVEIVLTIARRSAA